MRVLSPREWNALVDYDEWNDPFTPDDGVALHHGGGSDYLAARTADPADERQQLQQWESFHIYGQGWRGLAYGWAVGQSGTIFRIRGFNRYGAHLGDVDGDGIANNDEIIPIIWIASGMHHTISDAAHESIAWLRRNVIELRSPNAKRLYGHKEVQLNKPTSCPGPGGMDYVRAHRVLRKEDEMTELQSRIEVATGVFARTGQWMTATSGEDKQARLTRIAKEVVAGRPVSDVLKHFGTPSLQAPTTLPGWVLSPFIRPGIDDAEVPDHGHKVTVTLD